MDQKDIFSTYESQVRSYCRNFPAVFTTAQGSIMTDTQGRDYIDFFNGAGALNYGHNNPYIKKKVIEYLEGDGIMHGLDMMTVPKAEFISYMEENILKPRSLDYKILFPGPTGTNATEAALKVARKKTGREDVWSLMGGFHGMTGAALAVTSDFNDRRGAGTPLPFSYEMPAPYMFPDFDTVAYMQRLLDDDHSGYRKPAALILEAVQAEGGVYVLSNEYLREVRDFCTRNDILMIVDDVQVGCGRTGKFFSFERAGIVPDIVTMSKSIGGIGLPFAIVLLKPEIDCLNPGEHNGTFRGNQLGMVAGKASLEYAIQENVPQQAAERGEVIGDFLEKEVRPLSQKYDYHMDIRGIGCIWGVDMGCGKMSKKVLDECFKNGLIHERAGRDDSVVKLMPSLVIPMDTLKQGLGIMRDAIEKVLSERE